MNAEHQPDGPIHGITTGKAAGGARGGISTPDIRRRLKFPHINPRKAVGVGLAGLAAIGASFEIYKGLSSEGDSAPSPAGQEQVLKTSETTFDPNADKIVAVGGVNTVQATQEQVRDFVNGPFSLAGLDIQNQLKIGEAPEVKVLLPAKDLPPGNKISIFSGITATDSGLQHSVYYNNFEFSKGAKIPWTIEGINEWQVAAAPPQIINGKEYPRSLYVKAEVNGKSVMYYLSPSNPRDFAYTEALKELPVLDVDNGESILNTKQKLLKIKSIEPFFVALRDGGKIDVGGRILPTGYNSGGMPVKSSIAVDPDGFKALFP